MDLIIYNTNAVKIDETEYEVLERKGLGHPDTIADTLAEVVSAEYSQYTYNKYGYILRHMVDKITLLGGKSKVSFGKGEMVNPIRRVETGDWDMEAIPRYKNTDDICAVMVGVESMRSNYSTP